MERSHGNTAFSHTTEQMGLFEAANMTGTPLCVEWFGKAKGSQTKVSFLTFKFRMCVEC